MVNSHRGQALEKDVFRADVLAYLRMWPEVDDAESAADAICSDASQIVASIAQLTTTLSANEKSSPHKSQPN